MDKNELMTKVMDVEYVPNLELKNYEFNNEISFPIKNLGGIGSSIKPLSEMITSLTAKGGSGIYYVNTAGKKMFTAEGGFIGSLKTANGLVGGGQARMLPITFNPVAIASAVTMIALEHKLNKINEGQKEINDFLIFKEQAVIKGNINTLIDILNNYKYNAESEKYKNSKYILVQQIKNDSEKSILLLESLVEKNNNKKVGIHFNKKVDEYLKQSIDRLNDYQLGIYQYAFSSFLEIMLLENYDENYINSVLKSINVHKEKYESLYLDVKDKTKQLSGSSVQNSMLSFESKMLSGMSKIAGKTKFADKLLAKGQQIEESKNEKINKKIEILSDVDAKLTEPFEKTIEVVKLINNNEYNLLFDNENLYLDFLDNNNAVA